MASNTLTPEEDLLTREFYATIAAHGDRLFPGSPASARQLRAIILLLLNYDQLPNGAFVTRGTNIDVPFGSNDYSKYKDEWMEDLGKTLAAVEILKNEARKDINTSKASASESSEDTEVGETILREDVS